MKQQSEIVRNHLLAATMHRRWETLTEIMRALRKDGMRSTRNDVWKVLLELSRDGVHVLDHRLREVEGKKEYQLHVKPEAIMKTPKWYKPVVPLPLRSKG